MKRTICFVTLACLLVASMGIPVYAASAVPTRVLAATNSVVRVFSEYSHGWTTGSGFVISTYSNATFIATNYHVVEGNPKYIYIYDNEIDNLAGVSLFCYDSTKDLCVLRLDRKTQFKPLPLNTKAERGDSVYAVGFPSVADYLSDEVAHTSSDATVTDGIISAIRSLTIMKGGVPVSLYQISAAINHGNSGGPLLDAHGAVVGINTYGVEDAESVNGAIAAEELLFLAESNGLHITTHSSIWEAILILIGVIVILGIILLVVSCINRARKEKAPVTLRKYISNLHQGLTEEQAVSLLMPVAVQLRKLHEDGMPHLQVSPDSIVITNGKAILTPPKSDESHRYSNGFAAPEIYKGKSYGQLTDIYSFCSVLLYAIDGTVPSNALAREEEEEIIDGTVSDVGVILQIGRSLLAGDRYGSMRDLILELSPYNTMATMPVMTNVQEENTRGGNSKKKEHKNRVNKKVVRLAVTIIAVVLLVSVLGYGGTYFLATMYADKGEFSKADTLLWFPGLTQLHDPQLSRYISAGQQYEREDYQGAEASFASCGDYRKANEYYIESRYQNAVTLFNAEIYSASIEIWEDLAELEYKDSYNYLLESKYLYAQYCVEIKAFQCAIQLYTDLSEIDYRDSQKMLTSTKIRDCIYAIQKGQSVDMNYGYATKLLKESLLDSKDASQLTELLYEATYQYACVKYHEADYGKAALYFRKTPEYKDAEKYTLLCELENGNISDADFKKVIANINFANTKTLLLSRTSIATKFLTGTWRSKNGNYYFSMQSNKDNSTSYNLPSFYLSNSHYVIENGIYSLEQGSYYEYLAQKYGLRSSNVNYVKKNVFILNILSADIISVFCFKDGKSYMLYRQ